MARVAPWLVGIALLAGICGAYARHHGDRESGGVHHHHNYYGEVHNYHSNEEHHDDDDDHHDDERDDHDDDHHDDDHHDDDHHDDHEDHHIYRFRVDDDYPGYSYRNKRGQTVGFIPDLLMHICKRAHKRCTYLVDVFTNCWRTQGGGHPGWGILDHWYDGCIGVTPTQDRRNSLNFTESFSEAIHWQLYFKEAHEGENLTGVKIGFVDGYSLQADCVHKHFEGDFVPVILPTQDDLHAAIEDGRVDAIPNTADSHEEEDHHLVPFGEEFTCHEEGLAMMAHYGSDTITWWNEVFDHAVDNGDWEEFCRIEKALHGDIHCNHLPVHH